MSPPEFLSNILSPPIQPHTNRPHVTLTYAQSLDAKIAGANGNQLILSGKESLVMTHWMRTMHDAILVGVGTALNDDPQLNTRHLPPTTTPYKLPRPVILDSELRLSPTCKLLKNFKLGTGLAPWVFCKISDENDEAFTRRRETLTAEGARIVSIPEDSAKRLSITHLLEELRSSGISSLMVEGGRQIISSFLCHKPLVVDILIVTVAPTLVGSSGVGATLENLESLPKLKHIASATFGPDSVIACRPENVGAS
ncbi:bacterial bifunctional deaminase-reductase [Sistotremastrum niveocremeum HHB9708]|uniref:2,5-diamino-6-ribosylamino-4(3H)-pyrimidinone 5'-phosphate reductase n=1 Tax=Sistotremastrum niveocremeum HHB9708 TaxID=1314777 RepID=A0A164U3H9_9AGAM|nr:bacterial bifunctional deaminase-reductase [Sistotremastrum niveocremeum HHB9708]